jgi:hypothetical protein
MAKEAGTQQKRLSIAHFEGINSTVQLTIAKKTELAHAENVRANLIGALDKRQGQSVIGTDFTGDTFFATGNYGLVYFEDGGTLSQGLIRVSSVDGVNANIYYLNQSDAWTYVDNDYALGLSLSNMDFANVDGDLVMVNGVDANRMLTSAISGSTTMVTSAVPGSLYNSPKARKVAFYRSRIYLADYVDSLNNRYKTTVLRSSYPLGIIALIDGDLTAAVSGNWVIPVTDSKYFYLASGMNSYEVYRGSIKIATITVSSMTETSITASTGNVSFESGYSSFLSSDEIWISGTYTGEKQYRWIANGTTIGRDVKQYDTFKLVGADESGITLLEPVGNILMIANKTNMMTWNDFTLEGFDMGIGCCSPNGYTKLKGSLFFMDYSGMYSTGGKAPELLSRKVERYINGATKAGLEACAMGSKGLSVFATIGDVSLYNNDGSFWKTLPDVCIEYSIADENFYVHTNVVAEKFQRYMSDESEKLTMTSFSVAKEAIVGAEMVTNGSFVGSSDSWEVGTGWEYEDGRMTYTS